MGEFDLENRDQQRAYIRLHLKVMAGKASEDEKRDFREMDKARDAARGRRFNG